MNPAAVTLREAWSEFLFGLKSGVVALTFIGLIGYLLMVLTNADYLQQMGAVDVPRNAPNLIYLMSSGDVFFLFFAWAWVFAQPVVRDRQASLHEFVLTAPVSLRALLLGRYLGALAVGLLLGFSQILGFLLSPLLEVLGLVPAGSIGPTPWAVMGWASLIFILIPTAGIGALYFALALKYRSSAGPFAASAVLMGLWMFSMIVLSEGGILVDLAAVLDPSAFGEVERLNKEWTPQEKATILYPLTTPFVLNRLLWGLAPLLFMLWMLRSITRESLIQERAQGRTQYQPETAGRANPKSNALPAPVSRFRWLRTLRAETRWQLAMLFSGRTFPLLIVGLITMTTAAGFVHGINHADGPFEARPEFTLPVLNQTMFLVIAFIAAALVGQVMRRDDRPGIVEILHATPAPPWVTFLARLAAVGALTFALLLTPGVAAMVLAAINAPEAFSIVTPAIYQIAIYGPGLAELVAVTVLLHCLIRRSGPAYAASMLATFIMVVNHEAGLVTYPPLEFGIPAHIDYSVLTGWGVWLERLIVGDAFKLFVVALLLSTAATLQVQGFDSRLRHGARLLRARIFGPIGAVAVTSAAACVFLYATLDQRFVGEGGYQSREQELEERANWERAFLPRASGWHVDGGALALTIDTHSGRAEGTWALNGVRSTGEWLHLELPDDLELSRVEVAGTPAQIEQIDDHAAVSLGSCATEGCEVVLHYQITTSGWNAEGEQRWLDSPGVWADATHLAPRLGLDYSKRILAAADRARFGLPESVSPLPDLALQSATGIAPAGNWTLDVVVDGQTHLSKRMDHALDFVVFGSARAEPLQADDMTIWADATRHAQGQRVAMDAAAMRDCVARRLGANPDLKTVAQLPRGMGDTRFAGGVLLLAEEPNWEVGASGTSRWRRQSVVAAALAGGVLAQHVDQRQNAGAQALISGVAGAIGYLCVGDSEGVDAIATLLNRASERISRALAAAESPIVQVTLDTSDAWLDEYVGAAYIPWVAASTAVDLQGLLGRISATGSIELALTELHGSQFAREVLGVPQTVELSAPASIEGDLTVERAVWSAGGWTAVADATGVIGLRRNAEGFVVSSAMSDLATAPVSSGDTLALADASAFERNVTDNKVAWGVGDDRRVPFDLRHAVHER